MVIKTIDHTLQGWYEKRNGSEVYHMSKEELKLEEQGKLAIVGSTIYGNGYRYHEYTIISMKNVVKIDIFYDVEDDYSMAQTIHFKDGTSLWGISRNHKEVELWEKNGVKINKSYGY